MGLTPFQPFKPVGYAHGIVQFVTQSWTGGPDEYEVEFDVASNNVHCSCADSVYRKKNYHPIGSDHLCKHGRKACEILWPVIARAIGAHPL